MSGERRDDLRIVGRLEHPSNERVLADPVQRQIGPRRIDKRQPRLDQRRCLLGHHTSSKLARPQRFFNHLRMLTATSRWP